MIDENSNITQNPKIDKAYSPVAQAGGADHSAPPPPPPTSASNDADKK